MIFYFIVFIFILLLMLFDRSQEIGKYRDVISFKTIAFFTLFLIAALRHNIGWDYVAYYDTISLDLNTVFVSRGELLNEFIMSISRRLNSPYFYFIFSSFVITFLVFKVIKEYSDGYWMSVILFLSVPYFYINSLSVIRFFMAISIVFWGIRYIEKRKFIRYLLVIVVAQFIHRTAFMAIILYFIYIIKLSNIKIIASLLFSLFLKEKGNLIVTYFAQDYYVYTQETSVVEGTKGIYFYLAIIVLIMFYNKIVINKTKHFEGLCNLYFFGVLIYIIFLGQGTMSHRLSLYGTIYSIIIVPKLVNDLFNKKERKYIEMLIYVFCFIIYIYGIYVARKTLVPYTTFLSNI